jgi:SagB-type dehydrogenase family enzyme
MIFGGLTESYRLWSAPETGPAAHPGLMPLPDPDRQGRVPVEQALARRRSVRELHNTPPLALAELAQLLWAGQGQTHADGRRTVPSAGATYPLELYLLAGSVPELPAGLYHYWPSAHALERTAQGDKRVDLYQAAMKQAPLRAAPAVLVIAAVYQRSQDAYGDRGRRFADLEAGHAAQAIDLQAVALNLGAVALGAFSDSDVKRVLELPEPVEPLYLIPVGRL